MEPNFYHLGVYAVTLCALDVDSDHKGESCGLFMVVLRVHRTREPAVVAGTNHK